MIEVHSARVSFEGGRELLRDVSWRLDPGSVACIKGPSGAGKTTLLRLLSGMRTVDGGSVQVFGRDVEKLTRRSRSHLRRLLGIVPQEVELVAGRSVRENIALPLEITLAPAAQVQVATEHWMNKLGLSHLAASRVSGLSSGERRRVAIARALAKDPQVILADEPTGDLDDEWTEVFLSIVSELAASGTTCVITTHDHRVSDSAAASNWNHYELRDGHMFRVERGTNSDIIPFRLAVGASE